MRMAVAAAGCELLEAATAAGELLEEIDRVAIREEERRRWLWRQISRRDEFMVRASCLDVVRWATTTYVLIMMSWSWCRRDAESFVSPTHIFAG